MPAANRKQALLPAGAVRIDNHWGTAPGFTLDQGGCRFVFLPGVPAEMKAMFDHWVAPELREWFRPRPPARVTLRVVGVGESLLQQRLAGITLSPGVRLGFRATPTEDHVKLLFPHDFSTAERDKLVATIRQALGPQVFSIDDGNGQGGDLIEVVDRLMHRADASLTVLETVSCGHLAQWCSDRNWWRCGTVIPDWRRAMAHFGIPTENPPDLSGIAITIANCLRQNTTHALASLGFDRSMETASPSLRVAIALATPEGIASECRNLFGDSERRRTLAAVWSLDLLRRTLSTTSDN
jgi:molybdopterin-biosynthesis enzyme MoeA-like protein